ncbi:hypothetical protein [Chryseobacterium indoltheticum]|uniref:hypothetical protein n=1 Tax=Chryseobacterium indoltheticum TaxID=254 RepID=UPI003F499002
MGSVTMGNFFNDNHERLTPAFQERWGNTYKINANGILNSNITNNSGTLLFAGKVLDLNNKVTEKDQLIVVNESPQGNGDVYNPSNPSNQQLKDEITFDIKKSSLQANSVK